MGEPSLERITKADLRRLARIAADEREDFFVRHAEWKLLYARRLLCTALCLRFSPSIRFLRSAGSVS